VLSYLVEERDSDSAETSEPEHLAEPPSLHEHAGEPLSAARAPFG
jgi:hypothetical protein